MNNRENYKREVDKMNNGRFIRTSNFSSRYRETTRNRCSFNNNNDNDKKNHRNDVIFSNRGSGGPIDVYRKFNGSNFLIGIKETEDDADEEGKREETEDSEETKTVRTNEETKSKMAQVKKNKAFSDKKKFRTFQVASNNDFYEGGDYSDGGRSNVDMRMILLGGCCLILLAVALFAVIWAVERNAYVVAQTLPGARGPPGVCNLSQANQTFVSGFLDVNNDARVGGELFLGDYEASLYLTGSCLVLNATVPLCVPSGISTNAIGPLGAGFGNNVTVTVDNLILDGNLMMDSGNLDLGNGNLTIGNVVFYFDGYGLVIDGNATFTDELIDIPIYVGTSGSIGEHQLNVTDTCLALSAARCLYFNAPLFLGSNFSLPDPFVFTNAVTAETVLYVGIGGGRLEETSFGNTNLFSPGNLSLSGGNGLELSSPVIVFDGNASFGGPVVGPLNLRDGPLNFDCPPSAVNASMKFDNFGAGCDCFRIKSDTGLCFESSGPQGITFSGNGNVTLTGPGMNLNFQSGAEMYGDVALNGNLDVIGNLSVSDDLTVSGDLSFQDLLVNGDATFLGGINATSASNDFLALNAQVLNGNVIKSYNLTSFYGLGATFDSTTTLFVGGDLHVATLQSDLRCNSPIFRPDTLTTPTVNPCVPECTDMQRCDHVMNKLSVIRDFEVGSSLTNVTGSVRFGIAGGKKITTFRVNAVDASVNTTTPFQVLSHLSVVGDIYAGPTGTSPHPCCTGDQVNKNDKVVLVGFLPLIPATPTVIALSEVTVLPFSAVHNPGSLLASNYNPLTYTFTAPSDGSYSFTVYLAFDPLEFSVGTIRGVTMKRDFSVPVSGTAVSLRICAHPTAVVSLPPFMRITCTYTGYFSTGNTAKMTLYHDGGGPLGVIGDTTTPFAITTRLEIYSLS